MAVTTVCEVGPGTVRVLTPRPRPAEPALVAAVLGAGREPLTLFGDQPTPVPALWDRLFGRLLCGAGPVLLVHPSWWSPARVAVLTEAAGRVATPVTTRPRHAVHGARAFVEIGPEFVAIGDDTGVTTCQPRATDPAGVADEIAGRFSGTADDNAPVLVDAPAAVPGAAALADRIAGRLRAAGRTVRRLDDRRLTAGALRTVPGAPDAAPGEAPPARGPRRAAVRAAVVTVPLAATAALGFLAHGTGEHRTDTPATELVEGRVAVQVPADWPVRRVTGGPGSARVEVASPSDPGVILHITQSRVPDTELAATARTLRAAVDAEPAGVFADFDPEGRRAGRPAVTYREIRPGREVRWTVVLADGVRISIGCQRTPDAVCDRAVRSARPIG